MLRNFAFMLILNFFIMITLAVIMSVLVQFGVIPPDMTASLGGLFVLCLFWGMGGSLLSLLLSKQMAKWTMGVKIIQPGSGTSDQLVNRVHQLAKAAGLNKMPEVGYYESPEVNAFATGPSKNNSLVAVSTGLLRRMDNDEVEGVLAHEVSHIANGDMVTMTLVQGVVNAFVMFFAWIASRAVTAALSRDGDRDGGGVSWFVQHMVYMMFSTLFGILAMPIVMWFSRWREFRADEGGAKLAGRNKMIQALVALKGTTDMVENQNEAVAAMKISGRDGIARLFMSHPPLDVRIKALQKTV